MKHSSEPNNEFFTGNKSKKLLVHVLQNGVEITKPIKCNSYDQKVTWRKRQWYIYPKRFIYDNKGLPHQYVDVNDVAVLSFNKDHEDNCRKCGGKMTVDARQARELGKQGVFHAIWGIESTHMILLIIFAIGMMGGVGFGFYSYNQDTLHKSQLESAQKEITRLNYILNPVPVETDPNTASGGNRR